MQSLGMKLRHTARRLARAPMFTIVAVTTLAVGIGANSAIFSVVNGVLLKPLPFSEPERLVSIWYKAPGLGPMELNQGRRFISSSGKKTRCSRMSACGATPPFPSPAWRSPSVSRA